MFTQNLWPEIQALNHNSIAHVEILMSKNFEEQKINEIMFRRQVHGDTTDVFKNKKAKQGGVIKGPSPFAELSNLSVLAMAQFQSQQPQNQPPNTGFNTTGKGIYFLTHFYWHFLTFKIFNTIFFAIF